jgi:hypothetical protein
MSLIYWLALQNIIGRIVAESFKLIGSLLLTIFVEMANKAFENFKDDCVEHLSSLQNEFMKLYDINSYEHWYYDHRIGAFHFKSDDGRNLYFKYIDVGSYSTKKILGCGRGTTTQPLNTSPKAFKK